MEHYWRSKRLLFEMLNESKQENKTAIVNADDELADEFLPLFQGTFANGHTVSPQTATVRSSMPILIFAARASI